MTERSGLLGARLVNRLVIVTLVAGLGAGLLGALLLQRTARSASLSSAQQTNRVAAAQYAVRLDNRIDSLFDVLRLVATRDEITMMDDDDAASDLRVVLRVAPSFEEIVLFDGTREPVAAAASRFVSNLDRYAPLAELPSINAQQAAVVVDANTDRPRIELAVAVENPPGNIVGALVAYAPIEAIAVPLEGALASGDPVPFLVDRSGEVVVHRDRSQVVRSYIFPIDTVAGADRRTTLIDRSGEMQLVTAAPLSRFDGFVVVEQPEALARASADLSRLIVILAAVMVAVVLAVIITGEILLRPLRPLTAAVTSLGRGQRNVRTSVGGYAEIGRLGTEVNRMAEALDRRDDQVEELRKLSLVVSSLSDRSKVVTRVAASAAKLLQADGAAVLLTARDDGGPAVVEASFGDVVDFGHIDDVMAGAQRTGELFRRSAGEPPRHLAAALLVGPDGEQYGGIVVHRLADPFDTDEETLLSAFAAFASVAVANSQRLDLQQALAQELQDAIDRRRDLLSNISHEFRTPLTCIEGFSSALLDGWSGYDDEQRRELVGRIAHHSSELDGLVGRFLDFAVAERGAMTVQAGVVRVPSIISQTLDALAPMLVDRHVETQLSDIAVLADPTLLRQVMTNLLSNAVKFSPAGSRVTVRTAVQGQRARIEVIDEGIGLTAHEATSAFRPFWRSEGTSTRTSRGVGLGLALVAEYVRLMDGACGVTSEPGHGSNFYVVLPLAQAHSTTTAEARPS